MGTGSFLQRKERVRNVFLFHKGKKSFLVPRSSFLVPFKQEIYKENVKVFLAMIICHSDIN